MNALPNENIDTLWGAFSSKHGKTAIFRCTGYDPAQGFLMVNVNDPEDVRCISERALYVTWWPAEERTDDYFIPRWSATVNKETQST